MLACRAMTTALTVSSLDERLTDVESERAREKLRTVRARWAGLSGLFAFILAAPLPWVFQQSEVTASEARRIVQLSPEIAILILAGFGAMPLVAASCRYFEEAFDGWSGRELGVLPTTMLVAFASACNTVLIAGIPFTTSVGLQVAIFGVGIWFAFGWLRWREH